MVKYTDMGDGTLVNLALIGEGGAFDELVQPYEDAVPEKAEQIVGSFFRRSRKKIFRFFTIL